MANNVRFSRPNITELKKKYFVADIHHHSRYSFDSGSKVEDILENAQKLGIYLAITDHNAIGGVLKAYESPLGKKLVIPGVEITTKEGKDVLIYFYSVTALKKFFDTKVRSHMKHKSSLQLNKTTYPMHLLLEDLQQENCLIVLPHPVCARIKSTYHFLLKKKNRHLLNYFDAIEVINETMTRRSNLTALGWAVSLGKPMTAGSDGHQASRLGDAVTAAKAKNKMEFLDAIKAGKTIVTGTELRFGPRMISAVNLVREKVKVRSNKRLSREYE